MTGLGYYASSYICWLPMNRAFEYDTSTTTSEGEITFSMSLENLTKKTLVIICGGIRDVV
jgi:hypothetical protein